MSGLKFRFKKNSSLASSSFFQKKLQGPKRVCCTAQLKHRHPASTAQKYITWGLLAYWAKLWLPFDPAHSHIYRSFGASCSNIGRIRTKENIAVGTLLIGATPKPLGATWSYSNPSLTPLERFTDRIRIRSLDCFFLFGLSFIWKQPLFWLETFLFKDLSVSVV